MKITKPKFLAQLSTGIFGGVTLGILNFVTLMGIGGNYGCLTIIDKIFGTAGYESCGSFGAISGILLGNLLGITIVHFLKLSDKKFKELTIKMLASTFIIPFLFGLIIFWPPFEDDDILLVPVVISTFFLVNLIPSLIITSLFNLRRKRTT